MKTFDKIVAYVYQAEIICPRCVRKNLVSNNVIQRDIAKLHPEEILDLVAMENNINRNDEYSFDSSVFPKVIFATDVEFGEDFCGKCGTMVYS